MNGVGDALFQDDDAVTVAKRLGQAGHKEQVAGVQLGGAAARTRRHHVAAAHHLPICPPMVF